MVSNRTPFLCFPRDNPEATQQVNDLIIGKVSTALKGHWANPDLVSCAAVCSAPRSPPCALGLLPQAP